MISINKGPQPNSLLKAIKDGETIYLDLKKDVMVDLRKMLLYEQGCVCCYCQKRIPEKINPKSKIEHFKSRENFPELQLEFRNMFIACNGKGINSVETCDTFKKSKELNSFNFLNNNIEEKIKYAKNGVIFSIDEDINNEINEVLNLNEEGLRQAREYVYKSIKRIKQKLNEKGQFQRGIKKLTSKYSSKTAQQQFESFYGVKLYYINK